LRGEIEPLEQGRSGCYPSGSEPKAEYLGTARVERAVGDAPARVLDRLDDRAGAEQMVLPLGRQLRHRGHRPVEAAQIVPVAVAEPERVTRALPATGDAPVARGEVGRVAQGPHGLIPRGFVACARVEKCV